MMRYSKILVVILFYESLMSCNPQKSNHENNMWQLVEKVNQVCPITMDSETRVDNAMYVPDSNSLIYNCTLTQRDKSGLDLDILRTFLEDNVINKAKTSPELAFLRDNDVTLIYRYSDRRGNFLLDIKITLLMYK